MAKRSRVREGAYTLFFMLAVTSVFIAATSAMYHATKDRVTLNKELHIRRAILRAAGDELPPKPEQIWYASEKYYTPIPGQDGSTYYVGSNVRHPDKVYVFLRDGAGLWGTIGAAIGFTAELDGTISGIAFTTQNETPGLGARIEEEWFAKQFVGKRGPFTTRPEGEKTPSEPNVFDAITGATITTNAVRDLINKAIEDAPKIVREREDR